MLIPLTAPHEFSAFFMVVQFERLLDSGFKTSVVSSLFGDEITTSYSSIPKNIYFLTLKEWKY